MASDSRLETKDPWPESSCQTRTEASLPQQTLGQCPGAHKAGKSASEELKKCPPPFPRCLLIRECLWKKTQIKNLEKKAHFPLYRITLCSTTNCTSDRAFSHTYNHHNTTNNRSHAPIWDSSRGVSLFLPSPSDMRQHDSIQLIEFNPATPMWTQHRINMEKLKF